MSTPSFFSEPRLIRLGKLLSEIKQGEIHVPRFQRPFVWTPKQRLDLLQSVYLGYPIGSILVWRTQTKRLQTYEGLGPVRLPPQNTDDQIVRQYLLDGHQRITTLFTSLGPGLYDEDELKAVWTADEGDLRWPVYFDLLDEASQPFRLLRRKHERVPQTWLPLDILLDSYTLGEFKDGLREQKQPRELVNRVQAIADTLRDYTVPLVPVATEDLEQVTTSFKRVNSGGSKMSEVHMVNALTWTEDFDLLERLEELALSLEPLGWGAFDTQMILNVCKSRLDLDIYGASAEDLASGLRQDASVLDEVREAIARAADVLREVSGVQGPKTLPYNYQAVLLADSLPQQPLSERVKREIRSWFWCTTLTEYFQGMTSALFKRTRKHLRELIEGKATAKPPNLPSIVEPSATFDFRGARSRAMALLLAERGPMATTGEPAPAYSLLAEHGHRALVPLIRNNGLPRAERALTQGPQNRFLLAPREGAASLRQALTNSPQRHEIAASHVIPQTALDALQRGDDHSFLDQRRSALWALERARAEEFGLEYREP